MALPKTKSIDISTPSPARDLSKSNSREQYDLQIRFRTLSVRADEPKPSVTRSSDPAIKIREIDVHRISIQDIFTRFSTSPSLGLETVAVERQSKLGKNVISPPKTQYWKKALNYVFGGFNFLMWIAFLVTLISYKPLGEPNPSIFSLGVAMLLMGVIIMSAAFYAIVDFHSSQVMKSIRSLIADDATVVRDGKQQTIPAADIVVGDLVMLSMGDRVPADLRIVQASSDLRFDRSLLTGESDMIPGTTTCTSANALETRNLALTSTFVAQGTCTGVAFAIGDRSVMGLIVAMSGETKFKLTTVQKEIWFFTKIISIVAATLFCISIIVWAAWLRHAYPGYATASVAIINSIGCLTAFVPQSLPVCVALSLTIIARRMASRHVLVKNLATIETLGCMTMLCTDKTGTLTEGKMSVNSLAFIDAEYSAVDGSLDKLRSSLDKSALTLSTGSLFGQFLTVARLCNGAKFETSSSDDEDLSTLKMKGDATDTALLRFAETELLAMANKPSLDASNPSPAPLLSAMSLISSYEKIFEIPFNSGNKWMLSVVRERHLSHSGSGEESYTYEPWMLIKGAPDVLFPSCEYIMNSDGKRVAFDDAAEAKLSSIQRQLSSAGQRVLVLCKRSLEGVKVDPASMSANAIEELLYSEIRDLTVVGLVAIRDPPRGDVEGAVAVIRRAGVRIAMVTGDFALTAIAIAKQVGIVTVEKIDTFDDMRRFVKPIQNIDPPSVKPSPDDPIRALVLTGDNIEKMDARDWDAVLGNYTEIIYARTTPEQKLRIVEQSKARGDNIVAVTGDGVNDAPALKASDVGVAMGSGSDVAKEAAAIILLRNDFASIPVAIEMGRLVFDNLKKVLLYLMPAGTYTEFITVFANVFLGMQLALSSFLQVWFCVTSDVVMSISLMYEKPESDLMLRPPRNARTERLTDWKFFFHIYLFFGLMMWPCTMSMWFLYMSQQGLKFYDVILAYNNWADGYKGYTIEQLTHFVAVGQCIYYITMIFIQYGALLSIRNRRVSLINSNPLWGPRRNYFVPIGMVGTVLIAVATLYGPGIQRVFATTPIPGMYWGIPFCFALGILLVDETRKLIIRSYPKSFVAKMAW